MEKIIHIVTCVPDEKVASSLIEHLVSEKLIACGHIHAPHTAHYIWEGKREVETEITVTLKTTPHLFEKIERIIRTRHPYKLPYIAVTEWQVTPDYYAWVFENTI
jgi:periplasmic divalent cation tolerance protein